MGVGKKRHSIVLLLVITMGFIHGCTYVPGEAQKTGSPVEIPTMPEATETSELIKSTEPTIENCGEIQYTIASPKIKKFWWDLNSEVIYFLDREDSTGKYKLGDNAIMDPTVSVPNLVLPEWIPSVLPESVDKYDIHLSPSRKQAIFTRKIFAQPTPTPHAIGEGQAIDFVNDIYLIVENIPHPQYIGQVNSTMDKVIWSYDEKVLLTSSDYFSDTFGNAWMIDLINKNVNPILFENNSEMVTPFGFTPDNSNALMVIGSKKPEFWLKSFETGMETRINLPYSPYVWWTGSDELIVLLQEYEEGLQSPWRVYKFSLKDDELISISQQTIPSFAPFPDKVQLSPDNAKLAFIDDNYQLNVILLCH